MYYEHPKIKHGQLQQVEGASYLRLGDDQKIQYHRDYYDLGSMIYDHIPLLGRILRWIKNKLS